MDMLSITNTQICYIQQASTFDNYFFKFTSESVYRFEIIKTIKMKRTVIIIAILFFAGAAFAQKEKGEKENKEKITVPASVKNALAKKYPDATKVTWEKEDGNYEANWGGKSGEDNSVQFTPKGDFIEIVNAISVNQLPKPVLVYVKEHYKGTKITEAGKVTDAKGKISYEAEVNRKDITFDENGNFVKAEK